MSLDQQLAQFFWQVPPVTRVLLFGSLALGFSTWVGLVKVYHVLYLEETVFTLRGIPQVWRLLTSFLLPGPRENLLLEPYLLYTWSKNLEQSARFTQPGDYFVCLTFMASVILFLAGHVLGGVVFLGSLTLALTYVFSVDQPEANVTLLVFRIRAKYLPWGMLVLDLLMGRSFAIQATGLLAGHLYHFLTHIWPLYGEGRNVLATPQMIRSWFASHVRPQTNTSGGRVIPPSSVRQNDTRNSSSSFTSAFSSRSLGAWSNRGAGHRLGGD